MSPLSHIISIAFIILITSSLLREIPAGRGMGENVTEGQAVVLTAVSLALLWTVLAGCLVPCDNMPPSTSLFLTGCPVLPHNHHPFFV